MGVGQSCTSLDMRLTVLLVLVACFIILLLLYRLLQLRHRLQMARARHALEYYGFYRSATYRLRHTPLFDDTVTTKNVPLSDAGTLPLLTATSVMPPTITVALSPLLCPAPVIPPIAPLLPPPAPVSQATPPNPHLLLGACSETEVYSRIGVFRKSHLSSFSSQSRVILFEHSSL